MNFCSPFSPPGNPPVKPIISLSNPSSGTPSGNWLTGLPLSSGSELVGSTFLLSSFSRPSSPLHSPLPPRSWERSNLARATCLSLESLGIEEYDGL
ncbi:unnamed protein product [Linum tenue]|uniref:Uncharacterized protein n=1 Tax=Linum tenue TaxID=586396 RepID=A0AAV0JFK2_9ROSI|nr:unnamed protein product [Linum tenue]